MWVAMVGCVCNPVSFPNQCLDLTWLVLLVIMSFSAQRAPPSPQLQPRIPEP
jgi:hypothetical protein